jgi:hypothetical protein
MTRKALNQVTVLASILFVFIIWSSYDKLKQDIFIEMLKNSILLSLPLIALCGIIRKKANKVPQYITNSIGMIMIPIGLFFWKWMHHKSVFYEHVLGMLIACVFIGIVILERALNRQDTNAGTLVRPHEVEFRGTSVMGISKWYLYFALISGLLCIGAPILIHISEKNEEEVTRNLVKITKILDSYYIPAEKISRKDRYTTFFVLEDGTRYWSKAVIKDAEPNTLYKKGIEISFYASTKPSTHQKGTRAFGLWVNGQQISSLEEDLKNNHSGKVVLSIEFFVIGLAFIVGSGAILIRQVNVKSSALDIGHETE